MSKENLSKLIENLKEDILDDVMEEVERLFQELARGLRSMDFGALKLKLKGEKGEIGSRGVEGKSIVGPMGLPGKNGKDADEIKIIMEVLRQIPKTDEKKIVAEISKKFPELTAESIKQKLESLEGEKRLDVSAINGLITLIKRHGRGTTIFGGGGGGGDTVRAEDLSSQLDGSASTFTMPLAGRVLLLIGTQFPILFRPTVDFTTSITGSNQTTITLVTGQVASPQRGQTLVALYTQGG